uniref:DUF4368 domain-containing protein n=2 Tax=Caenorhabditis tropicalis TaxID=1561998 RepID=A0A1I7U167_9PELO
MSFVIGRQRSLSHSCLVRSAIEMPKELEKEIEVCLLLNCLMTVTSMSQNLDDVFRRQLTTYQEASAYIVKSLEHEVMENWQHISKIREACELRIKQISGDYYRATSYESMRIINTRLTDALNVIVPVKEFIEFALKRFDEDKAKELIVAATMMILEKAAEVEEIPITEFIPDIHIIQRGIKYGGEEIAKAPEENDLLLNENHTKRNEYEPPARRRNNFLSCFFPN